MPDTEPTNPRGMEKQTKMPQNQKNSDKKKALLNTVSELTCALITILLNHTLLKLIKK